MASHQMDTLLPLWNFDVPTNAIIHERHPSISPPPIPEMEILRSQYVIKLRHVYQELCQTREGIRAPRESFNRWLLERKVIDRGTDPMLPSRCTPVISPSMYREIMNDIPVKLFKPTNTVQARKQLFKYAAATRNMIQSRRTTSQIRQEVNWHVENILNWLEENKDASYEEYMKALAHLQRQSRSHLTAAAKTSVEEICSQIFNMSCEFAKKLHEKHWQILKEHNILEKEPFPELTVPRKVLCYCVQMTIPSPRLHPIEHHTENEMSLLKYKNETLKINTSYFHKLEQLYKLNCHDDPRRENFLSRVWCLLNRYQTFFGIHPGEGAGLQGALPIRVFECLHRVFGVTFECFASPLNCYFRQFCSAFHDTDGYFGSRGSILNFYPWSGSFEAGPPYSEELMEAMVDHFENLLERSQEPLSFIVYIPEWRDPPTPALVKLESSRFKRQQLSLPPLQHQYRQGFQHICPEKKLNYKATHGALVVFLQNDAGFSKWGPTPERVKEFTMSIKPT